MKTSNNECRVPKMQPLPEVCVPGNGVTITQSSTELFTVLAKTGRHYYQGGLVEITPSPHGPALTPLLPQNAVSELEEFVNFVRVKQTRHGLQHVPATITQQLARQYLSSRAIRDLLPNIKGLLKIPLLIRDSDKPRILSAGFDAGTGFYVLETRPIPALSLKEALDRIKFLIEDYDFATPGDRSRAIASIITPAMRFGNFITGHIPVEVAEADESQAGKTYRQTLVAAVYNEDVRTISQHTGGVGSLDEAFAERLVEGRPFIQFDNIRGRFDSTRLESFLTAAGPFAARVPNRGSVNIDPTKYIVLISSNQFRSTFDLANRSSLIAIRKRHGVSFRRFEHGMDLREHVKSHYEEYLGSVYAVIKYWHAKGSPRTDELQHSFRDWCQKLDWIVQHIFKEAPLMDGHRERQFRIASY